MKPTSVGDSPSQLEDLSALVRHELRHPVAHLQVAISMLMAGRFGQLTREGSQVLGIALENMDRLMRLARVMEDQPNTLHATLSANQIKILQLQQDFSTGLSQGQFYLVYQPIIAIDTLTIVGFEALARWRHPQQGAIAPAMFISLAEENGFIHQLGIRLIEEACHQLRDWQQDFPERSPLTVSVNISALQLSDLELITRIKQILHSSQLDPHSLKLEITESALIDNRKIALEVLQALKQLGVQLYLDDFGTGYSALARLQELPLDTLKIDRSFIASQNWVISEAIIALATKLGLNVIAEGIETEQELMALSAIGCQQMQGHFFSEPLGAAAVAALLANTETRLNRDATQGLWAPVA
jgi:EAL domain-containing protein (putative c-di-GMP-specific phosphodiesterase class I)